MTVTHPDSASRCPCCGKVRYTTKKGAKKDAHRLRKRFGRMDAYPCGDFFHIGHLPADVIAGERSRSELAGPAMSTETA